MKTISLFAIAAIIIFLPSCITTLQPLATEDRMITDSRLTGTWNSAEGEMRIEPVLLSRTYRQAKITDAGGDSARLSRTYMLSYEKNGIHYNMFASLIQVGEHLFMDLRPAVIADAQREDNNGYDFNPDYMPGYTIAKVEWKNDRQLAVQFADGAFVRRQLESGHLRLKHELDGLFGTCMISASSEELQKFVEKYATDERLFNNRNSVTLTRKG